MNERLQQIKDRLAKATDGPWHHIGSLTEEESGQAGGLRRDIVIELDEPGTYLTHSYASILDDITEGDAAFAAHARQDVPWLISELETAREEIESRCSEILHWQREVAALRTEIGQARKWSCRWKAMAHSIRKQADMIIERLHAENEQLKEQVGFLRDEIKSERESRNIPF